MTAVEAPPAAKPAAPPTPAAHEPTDAAPLLIPKDPTEALTAARAARKTMPADA